MFSSNGPEKDKKRTSTSWGVNRLRKWTRLAISTTDISSQTFRILTFRFITLLLTLRWRLSCAPQNWTIIRSTCIQWRTFFYLSFFFLCECRRQQSGMKNTSRTRSLSWKFKSKYLGWAWVNKRLRAAEKSRWRWLDGKYLQKTTTDDCFAYTRTPLLKLNTLLFICNHNTNRNADYNASAIPTNKFQLEFIAICDFTWLSEKIINKPWK